jgi:hypothetical protein
LVCFNVSHSASESGGLGSATTIGSALLPIVNESGVCVLCFILSHSSSVSGARTCQVESSPIGGSDITTGIRRGLRQCDCSVRKRTDFCSIETCSVRQGRLTNSRFNPKKKFGESRPSNEEKKSLEPRRLPNEKKKVGDDRLIDEKVFGRGRTTCGKKKVRGRSASKLFFFRAAASVTPNFFFSIRRKADVGRPGDGPVPTLTKPHSTLVQRRQHPHPPRQNEQTLRPILLILVGP